MPPLVLELGHVTFFGQRNVGRSVRVPVKALALRGLHVSACLLAVLLFHKKNMPKDETWGAEAPKQSPA